MQKNYLDYKESCWYSIGCWRDFFVVVWLAFPEVIRYDKIGEKNKLEQMQKNYLDYKESCWYSIGCWRDFFVVVWLAFPEVIRYDKIGEKNKFCEKSLFNSFDISKNNPEIFFTSSKKQKRSILAHLTFQKTIQKSFLHPQKNKREVFWPA